MKCSKCGSELMPGVMFCRECGEKIISKKRFCRECGSEFLENAKFCTECGATIDYETNSSNNENCKKENDVKFQQDDSLNNKIAKDSNNTKNEYADKIINVWNKASIFVKINIIGIVISVLLTFISLLCHNGAALCASVLALLGFVISYLVCVNIIRTKVLFKNISLGCGAFFVLTSLIVLTVETANVGIKMIPYSPSECIGLKYEDVEKTFKEAGFSNISYEEIEDVKPEDVDIVGSIEQIMINGSEEFEKGQKLEGNAQIVIVYHSFQQCNINMHVNFVSNLLLNKYDVVLYIDDVEIDKLMHGVNGDFDISLKPEEHEIKFVNSQSNSVVGVTNLTVSGDANVGYEISCYSNRIEVKETYFTQQSAIEDDDIMMEKSSWEFRNFNYQEVKESLIELGFENIEEEILYDIVWGWTESGSVESVSINEEKEFNRGDVFPKTANVTIEYHMPYEDNPNNIAETATNEENDVKEVIPEKEDIQDKEFEPIKEGNEEPNKAPKTEYATATTKVKIRKEANTECDVVGMLNENDKIQIIDGKNQEWCHVSFEDIDGYVKSEFLSFGDVNDKTENPKDKETIPIMPGSNVDAAVSIAKKYGVVQRFSNEDWGHGEMFKALSNEKGLMLDIVYSKETNEILHASVITNGMSTRQEQKEFIKALAKVLCPSEDSKKVDEWVNANIESVKDTTINGFSYELGKGPVDNLLFDSGRNSWEEWDMQFY